MRKMKNIFASLLIISLLSITFSSCYTTTHVVNDGAQGMTQVNQKAWYALWGLVPINNVDSQAMAAGNENYTITDQVTFLDYVIGAFTSWVTIVPKTVKVQY